MAFTNNRQGSSTWRPLYNIVQSDLLILLIFTVDDEPEKDYVCLQRIIKFLIKKHSPTFSSE